MISGLQSTWLKKTEIITSQKKYYKSWSIIRVRRIRRLRTDTRQCLFPAPLGSVLILFVTRSNGTFTSTSSKVITRLGTGVYFPIRSMSAGRHPCGALVYIYTGYYFLLSGRLVRTAVHRGFSCVELLLVGNGKSSAPPCFSFCIPVLFRTSYTGAVSSGYTPCVFWVWHMVHAGQLVHLLSVHIFWLLNKCDVNQQWPWQPLRKTSIVTVFGCNAIFRAKLPRNGPKLPRNTPKWARRAPVHTFCFPHSFSVPFPFLVLIFPFIFEGTYNTMGMFLVLISSICSRCYLVASEAGWYTAAWY